VPTYQYACTACDERLEAVQKFTDDPLTVCEVCGGSLRKVYSPVGIVFKGSGFYRTDSRNGSGNGKDQPVKTGESAASGGDGSTKADGKASGPSGDGPGASAGSGDSKPATKAEPASTGGGSGSGSKVA
jgi:putative FmdB family regulatory protein